MHKASIPFASLLAVLILLATPFTGLAALQTSNNQGTLDAALTYNPHKNPDDIILPMPHGLKMVLRPVAIPVQGMLYDKKFAMGLVHTDNERNIYESQIDAFVAAPLRQSDLPASWRMLLPQDETNNFVYYFIGKYEISNAQWHAVMEDPIPPNEQQNLPKANISWFDIQIFLQRYNTWLMNNSPENLPLIGSSISFLRLPSETEWEFAARGGNRPPEQQIFEDFPLGQGKKIEDYAVFSKDHPMPIGSKNPNSLNIYDMSGNVAELVQANFHFTVADVNGSTVTRRFHGATGGLVSKGGSFIAGNEHDVYPGKRVELPLYNKGINAQYHPYQARNLGMRLVLSNINIAGDKRARMLNEEYASMSGKRDKEASSQTQISESEKDSLVQLDSNGTPLQELDKVIAATSSPFIKSNLYQLRDILQDQSAALSREQDVATQNLIRSTIYKGQAIGSLAFRCWFMVDRINLIKKTNKDISKERIDKSYGEVIEFMKILDAAINFYKLSIKELSAMHATYLEPKFAAIRKEYNGKDTMSVLMLNLLKCAEKHIGVVRMHGIDALSSEAIRRDIIPGIHREAIEELSRKKY